MLKAEVAVIMPTFHRPISLKIAIDSVIRQSFKNWKLYIIGDRCVDKTEFVIKPAMDKHSDRIVWKNLNRNHGGGHYKHARGDSGATCRNVAFNMSSEPYIAYLDDDDRYHVDHLKVLYDVITGGDLDFVYTKGAFIEVRSKHKPPLIVGGSPPQYQSIGTNAIMHTRNIAKKVLIPPKKHLHVREDPSVTLQRQLWLPAKETRGAHDWEMIQRMMQKGAKYKFIPIVTYEAYWGFSQIDFAKMPRLPRYENVRK